MAAQVDASRAAGWAKLGKAWSGRRAIQGPKSRREVAGFPLVELLVVLAIVGLLVSILLPALSRARVTALEIKCQSNMRQAMIGFHPYFNDGNGFVPDHNSQYSNGLAMAAQPVMRKSGYLTAGMLLCPTVSRVN